MQTMVIEPARAFNGMDVLVARDEGLFAAAGLEVQFAIPQPGDLRSAPVWQGALLAGQARGLRSVAPYPMVMMARPTTSPRFSAAYASSACSRL
jgi:hypothetical protein